mmetsp:Transcript_6327/g.16140  ORF Transcript_6327/g.16140 Transcript_6327/m.16140 type:complete len:225 (+) Transcript_6327:107-781(+)
MQSACDAFYDGSDATFAMRALMPLTADRAEEACEMGRAASTGLGRLNVCQVANINGPAQVVISGTEQVVEAACAAAKSVHGARRAVALPVSAPFHSDVMRAAADGLDEAVRAALLPAAQHSSTPAPIVCNATAEITVDYSAKLAVDQLVAPVRWMECVQAALAHLGPEAPIHFVELGGSVLCPLVKQCAKGFDGEVHVHPVLSEEQVELVLASDWWPHRPSESG